MIVAATAPPLYLVTYRPLSGSVLVLSCDDVCLLYASASAPPVLLGASLSYAGVSPLTPFLEVKLAAELSLELVSPAIDSIQHAWVAQ